MRHVLRGIVERYVVCGRDVPKQMVKDARRPRIDKRWPRIDSEAATCNPEWGSGPLSRDLAWYVIPNGVREFFAANSTLMLHPSAERLLQQSRVPHEPSANRGLRWAVAVAVAYVRDQGWNEQQFHGRPNGGKPGERLGLDVAITREYGEASHGSHSDIASFAEKYAWCARHNIESILVDTVALHDADGQGRLIPPPNDVGCLAEFSNPAIEKEGHFEVAESSDVEVVRRPGLEWLIRVGDSGGIRRRPTPIEHARQWCLDAKLPDPRIALLAEGDLAPVWSGGQCVANLQSFVVQRNHEHFSESAWWVSAVAATAEEVLALSMAPCPHGFDGGYSSYRKVHLYVDPTEAVWAPWLRQYCEAVTVGDRFSNAGGPTAWFTTVQAMFEVDGSEESMWLPARWLCAGLGLLRLENGVMSGRDGLAVAGFSQLHAGTASISTNQSLVARRSELARVLESRGRTLVWWVRLLREPEGALRIQSGQRPEGVRDRLCASWLFRLEGERIVKMSKSKKCE